MNRLLSISLATSLLILTAIASVIPKASADDDAKINARIESWGRNCKNEVANRTGKGVSMADIKVELGATLKQSIDGGEMTLKDIEKSGLSYNWEVSKKKVSGSCDTNGKGKIIDFQMNVE